MDNAILEEVAYRIRDQLVTHSFHYNAGGSQIQVS
jgi:hypothetical protein